MPAHDAFAALYEAHGIDPAPPPVWRRAYIASMLFHTVKSGFCHWSNAAAEARFDADFKQYLETCLQAPTRAAFVRQSMRLLARLCNGHTHFDDIGLGPAERTTGFFARRLGADWIVTRSTRPDLQVGDTIETIDSLPVENWAEPYLDLMGKSSLRAKWSSLFRFALLPPRFSLRLDGGGRVDIDRAAPCAPDAIPSPPTVNPVADGVILLRVPSFAVPEHELAAVDLLAASGAQTAILDLRGNDGGSTPDALLSAVILSPHAQMICETPFRCGYFEASGQEDARHNPFPGAMVRSAPVTVFPRAPLFHGRLLVLVDALCASACEDFLAAFRASGRGPLLGETTCGSSGQPFVQPIESDRLQFCVGVTRFLFPDGTPLEGRGIAPHIAIAASGADLRAAADPVLAAALDVAALPDARYQAVFAAAGASTRQD